MSKRRDEILEVAIELFNTKGCVNTSTRHIANKLNISVGNLYYYFKNKEEIIIAVFINFMEEIGKHLVSLPQNQDKVFDFYSFMKDQMQYEKKYRFFRIEMLSLYTNYESVKKVFEENIENKYLQIKNLYLHQMRYSYLKQLDEDELDFLVSNTWTIASQWETYWIIKQENNEIKRRTLGLLNMLYFFKNYLTKKGLEESNLLNSISHIKGELSNV